MHAWLTFEGRHYDSEAIEGVENFLDLGIFKRRLDKLPFYQEQARSYSKTQPESNEPASPRRATPRMGGTPTCRPTPSKNRA